MGFIKNHTKPIRASKNRLLKDAISSNKTQQKNPVPIDIQGIRDGKLQQPTTSENSLYLIGKDEVPSSNLGNSSKKACNP